MKVSASVEDDETIEMTAWLSSFPPHLTINDVLVTDYQLDIEISTISEFFFGNAYSGEIKKITIDRKNFENFEFISKDDKKFIFLQRRYQEI